MVGRPVIVLQDWLACAGIDEGAVFRSINKWGQLGAALTPQAVNLILKRRIALAGLDPREFSAHGLRSGYLTEAARKRVPIQEAWPSRSDGARLSARATIRPPDSLEKSPNDAVGSSQQHSAAGLLKMVNRR